MTRPRASPVVAVLASAGVLVAVQQTIVVPLVADLPVIYDVGVVQASWVVTSSLLAGAVATPIVGRLADLYGKRRMVAASLVMMISGSLLLATSTAWAVGIAGRGLQGFSAALIPVAMSILKDELPASRVASGVALVSATLGIGGAIGLPAAGLLYGVLGWNTLFLIAAAMGAAVLVAVLRLIPRDVPSVDSGHRFDVVGALLLVLGLVPMLVLLSQGNAWGWGDSRSLALAGSGGLALSAFVGWELRAADPLLDLRLAARLPIWLTNVASLAIAMGMLGNVLIASAQLGSPRAAGGFGLSAGYVGLATAAPAAVIAVAAPVAGRLVRAIGGRRVLALGAAVMAAGYVARIVLDGSVAEVVVGSAVVGLGTTLALASTPMIIMAVVPAGQMASSNALNALFRMVGTAISTAGVAALTTATAVMVSGRPYPSVHTHHVAFAVSAAAALGAAGLALLIPRHLDAGGHRGATSSSKGLWAASHSPSMRSNDLLRTRREGQEVAMSGSGLTIDASVSVFFKNDADLRTHLKDPFRSRGYPDPDVSWFAPPDGVRYVPGSESPDGSHPGSDPEAVGREIFDVRGTDIAVLHPMSGAAILPDWHLGTAILAATNRMLAERWLDSGTYADRYRGTIRVNPNDIEGAVKEIERWKDHPRMVQIGLPMQTQSPYGRPTYKPIWRAASDAGLPVAIHLEMGAGITHPPTPSGITRTYSHLVSYQPATFVWHLLNMIAEGVFQEFPDLKIIWADGAADMLTPFMWRMDTFGRPHLEQTPWAPLMPSDYLLDRNYFVHSLLDGPGEAEFASEWLRMTGKEDMVIFGSSYPTWQDVSVADLPPHWSDQQRVKVLGGTAARLFGIDRLVPA